MCEFFSVISDGKGDCKYFTPADVVEIIAEGNPKSYDFNSHSSLMSFLKIPAAKEINWNKWEYNPHKKTLRADKTNVANDKRKVLFACKAIFKGKNILFLENLFGGNSGYENSGNRNSGNYNSGNRNSGYGNSGNGNSGNRNSGNYNSGDYNFGNGYLNSFCAKQKFFLFDKEVSEIDYNKSELLSNSFSLTAWVNFTEMSDKEKKENPHAETTNGFLKKIDYKEAWKRVPKSQIDLIKKLPGFDKKVWKEITGL